MCACVCSFRVNHVIVQVSSLKEKQVLRKVCTRVWAQARHTVIQKQKKAKKGMSMRKRFVLVVIIQTRASSQCMSEKKLSDIDWKVNIYFLNSNSMRRSDDILRIASLSRPRAALFFPRGLEKTSYRTFFFESGNEVGCEGKRGTRRRCLPKNV